MSFFLRPDAVARSFRKHWLGLLGLLSKRTATIRLDDPNHSLDHLINK